MQLNLASGNNFQLMFPTLPIEDKPDRTLLLHVFDSVLPGVSFDENVMNWQGWDIRYISSNMNYEPWKFSFNIDEKFDNWKRIYYWMENINNNRDKGGDNPWRFSAVNTSLHVYNNYRELVLKVTFNSILPRSLGDVELSFREGESFLSSSLELMYDYFVVE